MNYNILHGFHSEKHEFEKERLVAAQEAVKLEDLDILILTEACYGYGDKKDYGIKMDYGKLFEFPNYFFARRGDYEWGSAILSKYSIINVNNNKKDKKQHVRAIIEVKEEQIRVDIAHPHPTLSEEEKLAYFKDIVLPEHEAPYILAGDFNSVSDKDDYSRSKIIAALKGQVEKPVELVDDKLKRQVIPYLSSLGLMDTYKVAHPRAFSCTIPTDYLSKNKNSGMRMDFIFCTPDFSVEDAYILKNAHTEKVSDHYPTIAILKK